MTVARIEFVDYGVGEYGFFGKVVATTTFETEPTEAEIIAEVEEMREILGAHVAARPVEVV